MEEYRGCGFGLGGGCEWIIWLIIIFVLISCFCPGIFGGCGYGYKG